MLAAVAGFCERRVAGREALRCWRGIVYELSIEGEVVHVDSPLAGQHQQRNVALAIATAMELRTNHWVCDSECGD